MEKWLIKSASANLFEDVSSKDEKILYRVIANRNIVEESEVERYLNPSLKNLNDSSLLNDIDIAADIVLNAIEQKTKIRIVGDYDVDGVMSSYILTSFLRKNGGIVDYYIPDRVEDGYGINVNIVQKAIEDEIGLIITCDNGISAFDAVAFAVENGIEIIVTDHHDIPFEIINDDKHFSVPDADAVINPKQIGDMYPFKELCGAAVAYKLVEYIALELGIDESETVRDYLEFAAIATICDVMDLTGENRDIVKYGLELINNTVNIGLKALIEESQIGDKTIDVYHIGFVIGPSINASGRISSAQIALELLMCNDMNKAISLARQLRSLNTERISMTEDGLRLVDTQAQRLDINKEKVLVLYEPTIHESVAGIIAGKIKDKYYRPTIILTKGKDRVKGSARSIEGYNIHEELMKVSNLLGSFGGHTLAAGLSLDESNIDKLRFALNSNWHPVNDELVKKVYIDLGLPIDYINYDLIELLNKMEPFGKGNPRPIFGAKKVKLTQGKILGKNKNVLKLNLEQNGENYQGIFFGDIEQFTGYIKKKFGDYEVNKLFESSTDKIEMDIVYSANLNEFNGNISIQLNISNYR